MVQPIRKSPEELYEMMQQDGLTFLDVIDEDSFDDFDHKIEGAVRIKPSKIGDQFDQLPKEKTVAAY